MLNKSYLIHLLLIILLILINCSDIESIECFKCNSTLSYCGNRVIDLSLNETIECESNLKCIAYSKENITYRGCSNAVNISKIYQNNGCFIDNDNSTYCFCDTNKCNSATMNELKDLAVVKTTIHQITRLVNSSLANRPHLKPSLRPNYTILHRPILSKNLLKKLTSLRPTTKKVDPKVYQLKINDSISKETFRKRFSLKPDQKFNIVFVKIPVYNNMMNEKDLINKYSSNVSSVAYITSITTTTTTKTITTKTKANSSSSRKSLIKGFSPFTTKRSQWVMQNIHKKEYHINFKCPSNGLFPHPIYCNKFIQCLDHSSFTERWYVQSCPHGLYFNNYFKYCDYIYNVKCSYYSQNY